MKKLNHVIILLLAAALLCCALCACGGSKLRSDVPVSTLSDKVSAALGASDMIDPGENYAKGYLHKDPGEIGEFVIMKTVVGTAIDEYGIFKAGTMSTDALETMLKDYLQLQRDAWMGYQPEEEYKLNDAEVKTVGEYVMYCILSEADRATAFDTLNEALK